MSRWWFSKGSAGFVLFCLGCRIGLSIEAFRQGSSITPVFLIVRNKRGRCAYIKMWNILIGYSFSRVTYA